MQQDRPHEIEQLALWGILKEKGNDQERALVKGLVDVASPILDRVIETFPTYTLHNSLHARNVAELMALLLGPRLEDLSPLEAALLILAAYFHDIGMVFSDEARAGLMNEAEWPAFLNDHPEAYLAVESSGGVPRDIAEMYCRWRHADRVFVYLNKINPEKLKWGTVNFREELGELCRSHNFAAAGLRASKILDKKSFLERADLRFCAILLRLADILDFDRSRSPEAVYKHLGLARRSTPREAGSDVEWRKHLNSERMTFPPDPTDSYELGFVCAPDHPAIEHDIRRFLDVIEEEFKSCKSLLGECSDQWRDLPLPGRVKRNNIASQGYRYGEYRFTLDQENVLQLLMGENLYDSPFVFVRELLQNAIDASRLRQHLERTRRSTPYDVPSIKVSEWIDRDKYRWVRFDDCGTGMDESIITEHLLKVGSSYYNSSQYKADILKATRAGARDFVPISRFGIGLLSCFIACDRVEISTLRADSDGRPGEPIRLSLAGLSGYFSLQTPQLLPMPMPSAGGIFEENGYRTELGTSIACRLDPTRERGEFDFGQLLDTFLFCPLVPVEFEGRKIGGDYRELLETPWCERQSIRLTQEQLKEIGDALRWPVTVDDISIEVIPVDLTRKSISKDFRGQAVIFQLKYSNELLQVLELLSRRRLSSLIGLILQEKMVAIAVGENFEDEELDRIETEVKMLPDKALQKKITKWLERVRVALPGQRNDYSRRSIISIPQPSLRIEIWLGPDGENNFRIMHNGISLPPLAAGIDSRDRSYINKSKAIMAIGAIGLQDGLRPNLSLARSQVKSWSWEIASIANITFLRALNDLDEVAKTLAPANLLQLDRMDQDHLALGRLIKDSNLVEQWSEQKIFDVASGEYLSLIEIRQRLADGVQIELTGLMPDGYLISREGSGWRAAAAMLASSHLDLNLHIGENFNAKIVAIGVRSVPPLDGERLFGPLTFMSYVNSDLLRHFNSILNRDHAFAAWLIKSAPTMLEKYPGILEMIRTTLLGGYLGASRRDQAVETINGALNRLHQLDPSLQPGGVKLAESDFGSYFF